MASVLIPGTVEAEILMRLDSQEIENTLYFNKTGAWTPAEENDLALDLITWWGTHYSPPMSNMLVLHSVKITDWTSLTGAQVEVAPGSPFVGGQATEAMSNNVAPAISFHTASRGRSFRGRNYISGVPIDVVTQNTLLTAWTDAMVAAYTALFDVATANGCVWVVASRFSGVEIVDGKKRAIPRAEGITTPVTAAIFTDQTVDSQRNRLPNH